MYKLKVEYFIDIVLMEYKSDEINIGYRTVMMFINEHTLLDKIQKPYEVFPDYELGEQGGLGFHCSS